MPGNYHKPGCGCVVCDPEPDDVKFWRFVEKTDGCWLWRGALLVGTGYGGFNIGGKKHHRRVGAHRFSYALHFGPMPHGKYVLHRCDNRACVRPDHLFAGSQQENIDDMWAKGRARPHGTSNTVRKTRAGIPINA